MATTERASLIYRNGPTKIDDLELDVTRSEQHAGEVEVTEHPVEEGFNVTDHARPKPDTLTLDCIVSNTPLNRTQKKRVVKAFGQAFETTTLADQKQGVAGYAEAAYQKLLQLKNAGDLIRVITQIRTYSSMIISNLSVPRDNKTGDALAFTIAFRQVRVVRNKSTRKVVAKEPKAQPRTKTGKQTPKTTDEATKKKSIAYSTAEKLGLLGKLGIVPK